jgi:VWFA-related protein
MISSFRCRPLVSSIAALSVVLLLNHVDSAAQQQPTFSSNVNVINVLASVRNKKGEVVRDLNKDDFTVEVDGKAQPVKYFTHDTDLPLTLGLLVDTSMSMRGVIPEERTASRAFFDQVVREEQDSAFLIHFDRQVELLQDLTNSRQKLQMALDRIDSPELQGSHDRDQSDPGDRRQRARGGTLLYDSVYLASDEMLAKQKGRKAIIVISDGEDRGSKESLEQAVESAQRADAIVYSILIADHESNFGGFGPGGGGRHGGWGGMGRGGGMGRPGGGGYPGREEHPDGKKIMERLAKETGGRMFEVSKKQPIDKIYSQIQEELRSQYSLGIAPSPEALGPGYHKLHVTARPKDLTIQAREGYYGREQKQSASAQ